MARVLIAGAGPAGATLACLLVRRGVEVTLVERQRDFDREFRGEILNASGIDALLQMELGPTLHGVARHPLRTFAAYMNGRLLVEFEIEAAAFGGHPPTVVSQPQLLESLVQEAAKHDGFRLERGSSVMDLLHTEGRVSGVRLRDETGEREIEADLVIGCDGRASTVRKRAEVTLRRSDTPLDVVWCKLPLLEGPELRAYFGRGHLLIAYRSWDDCLHLGWVIQKGTFGALRKRGIGEWLDEMAAHVSSDFATHLRTHREAVQKPFLLDAVSDCVESWHRPGLLLLADAAHAMSPVGGQGINIALRDVVVATNELVPLLQQKSWDDTQLANACGRIQEERMSEVATIQALQAIPPRIVINRALWAEPVRRTLGVLLRRPFVQRRFAARARAFLSGAVDVELRV